MTIDVPMPLPFGDILRETIYWSGDERALLLLLLAVEWHSGPLPLDPAKLADALNYDEATFRRLWDGNVSGRFVQTDRGLINEALEAERSKKSRLGSVRSEAGKRGGRPRGSSPRKQTESKRKAKPNQTESNAAAICFPVAESKTKANAKQAATYPESGSESESEPLLLVENSEEEFSSVNLLPLGAEAEKSEIGIADPAPQAAPARADGKLRATRHMPPEFDTEPWREWAQQNTPGIDFDFEVAKIRDHQFRDAHSDWPKVVRNWLRRAWSERRTGRGAMSDAPTRFEQHKRRLHGA